MNHQRHDDFARESPVAARLRDQRIDLGSDSHMIPRSAISRRSLSPGHRVDGSQRVFGRDRRSISLERRGFSWDRRSNSLEGRGYSWDIRGGRDGRIRSRSPPLGQIRKRPNYDEGSSRNNLPVAEMRRRYEFYEHMDMHHDFDAGLRNEYGYKQNTSRVIREDPDVTLGQKSMPLDDGTSRGMYRLPTNMGPTSKNAISDGIYTSASVNLGRFRDERVHYPDPLLSDNLMEPYDKGDNFMIHQRNASSYTTVLASRSKDFMGTSHSKDFVSTSSGKSRAYHPESYRDGSPLLTNEYSRGPVELIEHMGFGKYGEMHVLDGRDPEVERNDLTRYRKDQFSPTRTEHRDYLYPRAMAGESDVLDVVKTPGAEIKGLTGYRRDTFSPSRTEGRGYLYPTSGIRESDDFPSNEMYRRMTLSQQIEYDSRPKMRDPMNKRFDDIDYPCRNLTSSRSRDHPSLKKHTVPNFSGMSRSSAASKDAGHYLDSLPHVEFGREVSRDQEIPHLGVSQDRDRMLHMRSDYSFERDASRVYQEERMKRPPGFQHEADMHRHEVRTREIEVEELGRYGPSNRLHKRKLSMEEELNWHDSKNIMPSKWNSSSRIHDQHDRDEEWIDQHARSSRLSKRVAYDHRVDRRAERTFNKADQHRVSVFEERLSFHEPVERLQEHPTKPYKSSAKYFKGHSKSGSLTWHNSYSCKPNNVWIRGKDDIQEGLHANDVAKLKNRENSAKSEPPENSEEFKQLVHEYFLSFTKKLNDNSAVRKRYMEQGKAGSLFCIVCGRSISKEFADTQSLARHAFMSHKVGLRAQHLGLHKAICVLLGWSSVVAPDVVTWFPESISSAEALAQKADLILWPPVIFICSTFTSDHDSERKRVTTVEAAEDFLRGKGIIGAKVKVGNDAIHNIMVVKFLGTFSGLQDAEKLQKYFIVNKRGRIDFEKLASGKGKSSRSGAGNLQGDKVDEYVLYGYMGIAEDMDKVDFDTKRKCSIKSKKDIQDLVDAPVKPV